MRSTFQVLLMSQDSDDSDTGVDYETALDRTGYGRSDQLSRKIN